MLRHEDLHLAKASGEGNLVVLYGARTGGDGIGGVSVLASETFDADGPAKRPSVQVGDPFMEKLLIECTLELFQAGVVAGIQDLGGAGLSRRPPSSRPPATAACTSTRQGAAARSPRPREILGEREPGADDGGRRAPGDVTAFLAITTKWDVEASVIGEVTETSRLVIDWHGEPSSTSRRGPSRTTAPSTSARTPARGGRTPSRPTRRELARPTTGEELRATLLRLVASPNLCDKSWITDQYDRYVQGNTVLAQPADRRDGPRRRGDPPRRLDLDGLQRPLRRWTRTPARSSRSPSPPHHPSPPVARCRSRSATASTSARRRTPT